MTMIDAQQPGTIRVTFLGTDRVNVTVEGPEEAAADVLYRAAKAANVELDLAAMSLVLNGTEVDPADATVSPGDRLTASGHTSNG
jgi:hypothetical protein